jgi:hypothetical protein
MICALFWFAVGFALCWALDHRDKVKAAAAWVKAKIEERRRA